MSSTKEVKDAVRLAQQYNVGFYRFLINGLVDSSLTRSQFKVELEDYTRSRMKVYDRLCQIRDSNIPDVRKKEEQINVLQEQVKRNDKLKLEVHKIQRSLWDARAKGQQIPMANRDVIVQGFPELCVSTNPSEVPLTVLCEKLIHKYNIRKESSIKDLLRWAKEKSISGQTSNMTTSVPCQDKPKESEQPVTFPPLERVVQGEQPVTFPPLERVVQGEHRRCLAPRKYPIFSWEELSEMFLKPRNRSRTAKPEEGNDTVKPINKTVAEKPEAKIADSKQEIKSTSTKPAWTLKPETKVAASKQEIKTVSVKPVCTLKPETKVAATKPESNSAATKPESNSAATKPETKVAATKPETKSTSVKPVWTLKPETKVAAAKPENKSATVKPVWTLKPETKVATSKPESKSASVKPAWSFSSKPETKSAASKPETKSALVKPVWTLKPETKVATSKPETKSAPVKPAWSFSSKPETKSAASKPETKSTSVKPVWSFSSKPETKSSASKPETKGASVKPVWSFSSKPETKGASVKPAWTLKPDTKIAASKPATTNIQLFGGSHQPHVYENKIKRSQHAPKSPNGTSAKSLEYQQKMTELELKRQRLKDALTQQSNKSKSGKAVHYYKTQNLPKVEKANKPSALKAPPKYAAPASIGIQASVVGKKCLLPPLEGQISRKRSASSDDSDSPAPAAKRARSNLVLKIFREESTWNIKQVTGRD